MRHLLKSLLIISFFTVAGCKEKPQPQPSAASVEKAMLEAEAGARRAHLIDKLNDAGTNTKKLIQVYNDAVELGNKDIQTQADDRLYTTVIPGAELACKESTFINLLKDAPNGSRYRTRLIELLNELNKQSCRS